MAQLRALLALAGFLVLSGVSTTLAAKSDECSLLQVSEGSKMYEQAQSRRYLSANSQTEAASPKCLQFMHIPKTGGTSIEAWGMKMKNETAFNSLQRETYERMAKKMGPTKFEQDFQSNLGTMFEIGHKHSSAHLSTFLSNNEWIPEYIDSFRLLPQRDMGFCKDAHSPPFHNPAVASWYNEDPDCEVFCAVRNPLNRFIGAYEMESTGPCDPKGFETTLLSVLPALVKSPSAGGCMMVPMVNYVYGSDSKETSFKQYCKHIIHTEHLDTEFAALMRKLGRPDTPTLPWLFKDPQSMDGKCKVDLSTVTQKAKDLIYEHYKLDFETFGYPRP